MSLKPKEQLSLRAGELFKKPCDFVLGAVKIDDIPLSDAVEVAFAGRSNVGKSSLLNGLTYRKNLARTSKTPGCTRQINFFSIGDKLTIADLPGYGYAKVSKKESLGWNDLIRKYLVGRPNLRRAFVLVDSRHGLKGTDIEIMSMFDEAAVSYQIVLTKSDKQKNERIEGLIDDILTLSEKHPALHPEVMVTSSFKHIGLDELRNIMADL